MTCHGFMFNGRCFPIYVIEREWPPKDPDPDPFRQVFDDLRILVTINKGIEGISDRRLRETLAQSVAGAARAMTLPDGLELGDGLFKGQMAMEAAE